MSKRSHFNIEEFDGNCYPDLSAAQTKALKPLASSLAAVLRSLLSSGILVNVNGRIIPNPKKVLL